MRDADDQRFCAKTARRISRRVELRERRELRRRAAIAVWPEHARKVNSGCGHVRRIELEVAEIVIDACRPASNVPVAKVLDDANTGDQLHISRRERVQLIL